MKRSLSFAIGQLNYAAMLADSNNLEGRKEAYNAIKRTIAALSLIPPPPDKLDVRSPASNYLGEENKCQ